MDKYFSFIDDDELLEMFANAVKIPSVNPKGEEKEMCEYVENLLITNKISYEKIEVKKDRFDIIAKIDGQTSKNSIAFTGHMDVVPVSDDELKRWITEPFSATVKDGCLYGRGSSDMKSGLISALYAMIVLKRNSIVPPTDIYLIATVDEENYMKGSKTLIGNRIFDNIKYLIVCEPTNLKICNEQKGRTWADVHVKGRTAHGSQKGVGENAIYLAIKLIEKIKNTEFKNYPDTFWRTLAINAGVEPQVVPDRCTFTVDARLQVGHDVNDVWQKLDSLISQMKSEQSNFNATYDVIDRRTSWNTKKSDEIIASIKRSLNKINVPVEFETFQGSTDASILIKNGVIPVIIGPGDLSTVHRENEHIKLSQLYKSCRVYIDIMTGV